jgi:hypothetical protein
MRHAVLCLILLSCCAITSFSQSQIKSTESEAIQKMEDDFLKAEKTTNISALDQILADDYVNLTPRGLGPTKAEILSHLQPHAGQPPPYSLETHDMRVYILGDAAVAAYTKTYTAKDGGNVAREDTTHIFRKEHGTWKLKISRATVRKEE